VSKFDVWKDELTLYTQPNQLVETLKFLRDDQATQFSQMVDITAVDYPSRENRFEVVYMLLSIKYNTRIKVKVSTSEIAPVPSVVSLYKGANWMEREVWDM
jgi:NADH dehydrogenase (ubiquinone) Fe-S protein 3